MICQLSGTDNIYPYNQDDIVAQFNDIIDYVYSQYVYSFVV